MKTYILWIIGILAVCSAGYVLYRILLQKLTMKTPSPVQPGDTADSEEKPERKEKTETAEVPLTEKQQLLLRLTQQREERALLQYRLDCAALFEGLSGAIQNMFAFEKFPDSTGPILCARLEFCADNESVLYRISSRKMLQKPEPLSPETENADEETLQNMLQEEKNRIFMPSVVIHWEELIHRLLPCMEQLVQAAKDSRAKDCKNLLADLRHILASYGISPVWYHEDAVQNNTKMQWDYIDSPSYPVPALYYRTDNEYIHVGTSGCTGTGYTYPEE